MKSGGIRTIPNIPRAPALETAAASCARATPPMPAWTIGWLMSSSFVSRVEIMLRLALPRSDFHHLTHKSRTAGNGLRLVFFAFINDPQEAVVVNCTQNVEHTGIVDIFLAAIS